MARNGSEQLEKAMEEVLDDDDNAEMKEEKSNVEKMEKHSWTETSVPESPASGISLRTTYSTCRVKSGSSRLKLGPETVLK